MISNSTQTFLDRFTKKDLKRKQSFELPESVIDLINDYSGYGKSRDVEVDTNQLVAEAVKDFLARDREFQAWRKESKDDVKTIKLSA